MTTPCCKCHQTEAERAYTPKEAAAIKSVSTDTIMRAIHQPQGNFLNAKKVGSRFRIAASDLEAWWDGLEDAI